MIRIGTGQAIPAVIASLGADPAEVLAEAGFDLALDRAHLAFASYA
jgi:hypothetical protein